MQAFSFFSYVLCSFSFFFLSVLRFSLLLLTSQYDIATSNVLAGKLVICSLARSSPNDIRCRKKASRQYEKKTTTTTMMMKKKKEKKRNLTISNNITKTDDTIMKNTCVHTRIRYLEMIVVVFFFCLL